MTFHEARLGKHATYDIMTYNTYQPAYSDQRKYHEAHLEIFFARILI